MYELYHHGIKGMKWGVRRYQNPDGSLTAEGKRRISKGVNTFREKGTATVGKAYKTVKRHEAEIKTYRENSKRIKSMSDKEIRDRINRINMEKQLRDLEKPPIVKGADTVSKILKSSGTAIAGTVTTAVGIYAVKKLIEKKWGVKVKNEIFPVKKK